MHVWKPMLLVIAVLGLGVVVWGQPAPAAAPQASPDAPATQQPGGDPFATPPPQRERDVQERNDPVAQRAELAIKRGLKYLARTQEQSDDGRLGWWRNDVGYKLNQSYQVRKRNGKHPGVTAIACLAFMAAGSVPGRGPYGEYVRRGLRFILSATNTEHAGYVSYDGSRMYSHAFATLFLAEVLGMGNLSVKEEREVRDKLTDAVGLIVQSQNKTFGSWRYAPAAEDADTSIAVCQTMALRAARAAGITVPASTIKTALKYVKKAYRPSDGAFWYQVDVPFNRTTWTLTAAGVASMQYGGRYDYFTYKGNRISLERSIQKLQKTMPYTLRRVLRNPSITPDLGYFYGHYYAAQAMYQYSRKHPNVWPTWITDVRKKLVALQRRSDGRWEDAIGSNYATAMACLILQIHHEYLPLFQK